MHIKYKVKKENKNPTYQFAVSSTHQKPVASSVSLPDVSATVKVSVRLVCYLDAAGKDAHFWAHLGHWQFQFPAVAGLGTSLLHWLSAGGHMSF